MNNSGIYCIQNKVNGKVKSEEHKRKISLVQKGKILPKEHRQKISESQKDVVRYSKPFKIISPTGEVIEGVNLNQFCKENGLNNGNMSAVTKGKRKAHKGYKAHREDINYV